MKVLLLQQVGSSYGSGAVVATYRLHRALQQAGVQSTIACRRLVHEGEDFVELPRADRIERLLGRFTWRMGMNDIHCVSSYKLAKFKPFIDADVVNIHGCHSNFFSYLALLRLSREKPIVATLHDMWNFTGHCGYSYDCDRWKIGCGNCPDLDAYPPVARDGTALTWKLKDRTYRRSPMTVVPSTQWLYEQVAQSMLKRFPMKMIRYGVDTDVHAPIDKAMAKEALDLPRDKFVILFVALGLDNHIKGGDLLLAALNGLPREIKRNAILLMMGDNGQALADAVDIPSRYLGFVRNDRLKVLTYSAADLFVLPSRAEVQGLVVLESMACGTPVVAFRVGGVPEAVEHGSTGELAEPEDPESLRDSIVRLLEDAEYRRKAGEVGRQVIVERFSMEDRALEYINLFRQILAKGHESIRNGQLNGEATIRRKVGVRQ